MTYRDDLDAAQERVRALERQIDEARGEREALAADLEAARKELEALRREPRRDRERDETSEERIAGRGWYWATVVAGAAATPIALIALVIDPVLALIAGPMIGGIASALGLAPAVAGVGLGRNGWGRVSAARRAGGAVGALAVLALIGFAMAHGVDNADYRACRADEVRWRGGPRSYDAAIHSVQGTDRVARGAVCSFRVERAAPKLLSCDRSCRITVRCGDSFAIDYPDGTCRFDDHPPHGFHGYGRAAAASRPELQLDESSKSVVMKRAAQGNVTPYRVEGRWR